VREKKSERERARVREREGESERASERERERERERETAWESEREIDRERRVKRASHACRLPAEAFHSESQQLETPCRMAQWSCTRAFEA